MIHNYIKTAWRAILRRKGYALINITGLATGLACCLLLFLFVRDEYQYDRFHEQPNLVHRVMTDWGGEPFATTPWRMSPALQEDFPEVQHATRLMDAPFLLQQGAIRYQENSLYYADSSFFDVFTFPLLRGDPQTALTAPFSIVLTASMAHKYFGDQDPIGQTLWADNTHLFTVTGVVADVPHNSHFRFDGLIALSTGHTLLPPDMYIDWFWTSYYTYLRVPSVAAVQSLQAKLPDFYTRHIAEEGEATGMSYTLHLEALPDLYLHSPSRQPIGPTGNAANLYIFSIIAVFVLLIAGVNFMNLATARSMERAKEVGVRKTVGARQGQLTAQFLTETLLLTTLGAGLALIIATLAAPLLSTLTGKPFMQQDLFTPGNLGSLIGVALGIGLLAGIYPALVLARFRPTAVLKGRFAATRQGAGLRRGLVVFQFGISTALIAGTLIVFTQLDYLRNHDAGLGTATEQMLLIPFDGDTAVQRQYEIIKTAFLGHPSVQATTMSSDVPGLNQYSSRILHEDDAGEMQVGFAKLYFVDRDFLSTYDIELLAGRDFSQAFVTDTAHAMLISETAVARFGYATPEESLGKRFFQWGQEGQIVGVFRNFHFKSLHERVRPLTMRFDRSELQWLSVRVQTAQFRTTLQDLEAIWTEYIPHRPFTYRFLDAQLEAQYQREERFAQLFGVFALLAMGIACLGLLGLTAFAASQRTKEIGVRKVMGASTHHILGLLTREILVLIGVALTLASPLTFFALQRWLDGFAYHITISYSVFLWAGVVAVLIALLAVSVQVLRAARLDPVAALRYE